MARFLLNGLVVVGGILLFQVLFAIPCAFALAKHDFLGRTILFTLMSSCASHTHTCNRGTSLHRFCEVGPIEHLFRINSAIYNYGIWYILVSTVL